MDEPEKDSLRLACECTQSGKPMKHEYADGCSGWNSCYYCDNGYYPCNQNCCSFGD